MLDTQTLRRELKCDKQWDIFDEIRDVRIADETMNLLISARPQRQTNTEGCRIFGDLDQLKSKYTIQETVD